jgi:hypothetical protein
VRNLRKSHYLEALLNKKRVSVFGEKEEEGM